MAPPGAIFPVPRLSDLFKRFVSRREMIVQAEANRAVRMIGFKRSKIRRNAGSQSILTEI